MYMKNPKKIITEALGLDFLFDLKKDEKVALKFLHKRYLDVKYNFELKTNELVDYLEDMGFNFTTSMKLATLYKNNREQLFKDYHEKYYSTTEAEILHNGLNKFIGSKSNEDEVKNKLNERFESSKLAKEFGYDNFYLNCWPFEDAFSFYISYHSPQSINRWKTVMTYHYKDLEKMSGNIDKIPFIVEIRKIEGNFPMPELEGSKDKIEIPITFDIDELNKKDIYNIAFGKENSLFSDFDDRLMEIISIGS